MLLRNPYFIDNFGADQPYNSMLIIAPYCNNNCKGCQNIELKRAELVDFRWQTLAGLFLGNPFWEGVTLAGLEPYHSSEDWWGEFNDFLQLASINKLTIYTSSTTIEREFPQVSEVYYKLGDYREGLEPKVVTIGEWSITLASNNQEFLKIS